MSSSVYLKPHHHWKPSTVTFRASSGGLRARSQIAATVGTITTARISAGAIVHAISRRVFPWICAGMRSRSLRWRNRIVIHTMPPSTTMKTTTATQKTGTNRSFSSCA